MRSMKKIFFLLVAAFCMQGAFAQGHGIFIISYPMAFPAGDLSDYISNTSFRGINMEWGKEVKPNVIVEIETGWNVFYQEAPRPESIQREQLLFPASNSDILTPFLFLPVLNGC